MAAHSGTSDLGVRFMDAMDDVGVDRGLVLGALGEIECVGLLAVGVVEPPSSATIRAEIPPMTAAAIPPHAPIQAAVLRPLRPSLPLSDPIPRVARGIDLQGSY